MQFFVNVIPVKSNVEFAVLYFIFRDLFPYFVNNLIREVYTAWLNANKYRIIETNMIFDDLVRQSFYCDFQLLFAEDRFQAVNIFNKNSKAL